VYEVYVGGKPDLLTPFVGKRVKITGKYVLMEVEGRTHREIWPARIEAEPAATPPPEKTAPAPAVEPPDPSVSPARLAPDGDERPAARRSLKIIARGYWSHGAAG